MLERLVPQVEAENVTLSATLVPFPDRARGVPAVPTGKMHALSLCRTTQSLAVKVGEAYGSKKIAG